MYCWGKADDGALGLGGIETLQIPSPTFNRHVGHRGIRTLACGHAHTVLLLEDGAVYSCGNNECGQLGHEKGNMRPAQIESLLLTQVTDVQCGHSYSVVLLTGGQLYSWGDNTYGQLGLGGKDYRSQRIPKPMVFPSGARPVVQVVCGGYHTMALTQDGKVFSWGRNTYHQLGHSQGVDRIPKPVLVKNLESVPVLRLAAGNCYSFAISVGGSVFGWGRNNFGQLGLGNTKDQPSPLMVKEMSNKAVRHIACSDKYSVMLTDEGCVYRCGCKDIGSQQYYSYPEAVSELEHVPISQVACGRHHTLLVAKTTGAVYSFGIGSAGQLGCGNYEGTMTPVQVMGEWLTPEAWQLAQLQGSSVDVIIRGVVYKIYAGGDHSFITILTNPLTSLPADYRVITSTESPFFLTYDLVKQMLDVALITSNYIQTLEIIQACMSSASVISGSFLTKQPYNLKTSSGVMIPEVIMTFKLLRERLKMINVNIDAIVKDCFYHNLLPCLPEPLLSLESLRLFLIIVCYPMMQEYPDCLSFIVPFVKVFLYIEDHAKDCLETWVFNSSKDYLMKWVETFRYPIAQIVQEGTQKIRNKQVVSHNNIHLVPLTEEQTWALQEGIKVLRWLHEGNTRRKEPIPHQAFYVDEINECIDLKEDYLAFRDKRVDRVLFMRYPFALNMAAKSEIIQVDGKLQMRDAVFSAHTRNFRSLFQGHALPPDVSPMACMLQVRRSDIVTDTLSSLLSISPADFKKPLLVQFIGEEGLDEGGVRKEFFMLLIREILNPDFGMFYEDEESKLIWFREHHRRLEVEEIKHYFLVGIICGLAIYNAVIVNLPFPLALYKKILGCKSTTLDDLTQLKPSIGKHLQTLLQYEGDDFDEVYHDIKFDLTRYYFGSTMSVDLIPNGSEILLTKENREKYVEAYVEYELHRSVKDQYQAFLEGFIQVCNLTSDVFKILHPSELMAFVTGSNHYDFNEFIHCTKYISYSFDDPVIQRFWSVAEKLTAEAKKKLLIFWTGSDRIPVAGPKSLRLRIQRMDGGPNCQRLPVAHTCANILDLPPYPSHEAMRSKLLQAINFTTGFGIV